jgi:hypothetical protein
MASWKRYPPGTKFLFSCPLCDAKDDTQHGAIIRHADGWGITCWRCPGGGDYLRELAAAVGCDLGGYVLLDDPLRYLGDLVTRSPRRPQPVDLPTHAEIEGWHSRLLSSGPPLEYLLTSRGLSADVISRYKLGWDGAAFTLPVYSVRKRRLTNLRRRSWPDPFPNGARYVGLAGRTRKTGGIQLYPDVPHRGGLLLCGGELDALVARGHGIPGIACTAGVATHWPPTWNRLVRGRQVVVAFDVGEQEHAQRRVELLAEAGARAWSIDLGGAGLAAKEDVTDWFVRYGRTADDLRALAREARPPRLRLSVDR